LRRSSCDGVGLKSFRVLPSGFEVWPSHGPHTAAGWEKGSEETNATDLARFEDHFGWPRRVYRIPDSKLTVLRGSFGFTQQLVETHETWETAGKRVQGSRDPLGLTFRFPRRSIVRSDDRPGSETPLVVNRETSGVQGRGSGGSGDAWPTIVVEGLDGLIVTMPADLMPFMDVKP
jgi:hypothetical protein